MKKIKEIRQQQKRFIKTQLLFINDYCNILKKNKKILAVLLSGSTARGTFMPGEMGGAIDLIIFCKDIKDFDPEKELGKDLEEDIPGHFIKYKEKYYQVKIYDNNYFKYFSKNSEPEKYAFFESKVLFDTKEIIQNKINRDMKKIKQDEIPGLLKKTYKASKYFINDYKVDRWKRRDAIIQLNQNLSKSIELSIRSLFYINDKYAPAEDRALYFSFELKHIPANYEQLIHDLQTIRNIDIADYEKRESIYKLQLLNFIQNKIN